MSLKVSSAKWWPFFLGLNVLICFCKLVSYCNDMVYNLVRINKRKEWVAIWWSNMQSECGNLHISIWIYSDRTIYFQVFTNVPILVRGCNIIESAHSCHLLSEPWELHIHIRYFLKLKTVVYCLKPLDCKAEVGTNWTKTKCGFCWGFRPVCKWMADVFYICNHKMYHFVCIFIIFSWIVFWYNTIFHSLRDLRDQECLLKNTRSAKCNLLPICMCIITTSRLDKDELVMYWRF